MVLGSPLACMSTTASPVSAADLEARRIIGQRRDVVEDRGAGVCRRARHACLARIDRDHGAEPASPSITGSTRRARPPSSTGSEPGPRRTRPRYRRYPRRLAASSAAWTMAPSVRVVEAAVGEAVRRDVDDAHEQRAIESEPGEGRARRGDALEQSGEIGVARTAASACAVRSRRSVLPRRRPRSARRR